MKAFAKTRHEEALVRQEAYNKLSTHEKIAKLNEQNGKDVGAVKQRAKLAKQLEVEHEKANKKK